MLKQALSSAMLKGSRSGSGKLVVEFYDQLAEIYGSIASTRLLRFGCEFSQQSSMEDTNTENLSFSAGWEQSFLPFLPLLPRQMDLVKYSGGNLCFYLGRGEAHNFPTRRQTMKFDRTLEDN